MISIFLDHWERRFGCDRIILLATAGVLRAWYISVNIKFLSRGFIEIAVAFIIIWRRTVKRVIFITWTMPYFTLAYPLLHQTYTRSLIVVIRYTSCKTGGNGLRDPADVFFWFPRTSPNLHIQLVIMQNLRTVVLYNWKWVTRIKVCTRPHTRDQKEGDGYPKRNQYQPHHSDAYFEIKKETMELYSVIRRNCH